MIIFVIKDFLVIKRQKLIVWYNEVGLNGDAEKPERVGEDLIIVIMGSIVFISCCSKKAQGPCPAKDLYISPLFKKSLAYARKLTSDDKIFILSAKHKLITLNNEISSYNKTLNTMRIEERKEWAGIVNGQIDGILKKYQTDEIIVLAGEKYREFLDFKGRTVNVPLKGMRIGQMLKCLK